MDDGHMAGQHIREIFEHPERRQVLDAFAAPTTDVKLPIGATGRGECASEFVFFGRNQTSANVATESAGRNGDRLLLVRLCNDLRVVDRFGGRTDGEFDIARHDLGGLAVGFRNHSLHVEQFVCDLRNERRGKATEIERVTGTDAALALAQSTPESANAEAKGGDGPSTGDNNSASLPCHGRSSLRRHWSYRAGYALAPAATVANEGCKSEQCSGSWCRNHSNEERFPAKQASADRRGPRLTSRECWQAEVQTQRATRP